MNKLFDCLLIIKYFDYSLLKIALMLIGIMAIIFFIIDFNIWNKTGKSIYKKVKKEGLKC